VIHLQGDNFKLENTCVAFGRFDGLHRGHRAVIEKTAGMKASGFSPVLVSFDFCGTALGEERQLCTEEEKRHLLQKSGLDLLISYPFSEKMWKMDPEGFFREILLGKLGARVLVTGEACTFGFNRTGDIAALKRLAERYGVQLLICKTEREEGREISSSWIKEAVRGCDLEQAKRLLGKAYTIVGEVVHGKALGRTVGLPTANISFPEHKLLPPQAIYVTRVRIDGEIFPGMTILGQRPTVDNFTYITIETYILDFSTDIYGKTLELELHSRLRDIRKFNNLAEVKIQVEKDKEEIREYLYNLGKEIIP